MKKSFILYTDQREVVDSLTNEQAGILFKTIYQYHNEEPYTLDALLNIAFIPFKQTFKRDEEKWSEIREKRAEAGKMGGINKAKNLANVANASFAKQKVANVAVSVSDSVSVSVSENVKKNIGFENQNRKSITFKKEDYKQIMDEYESLKGIKLQGNEYLPVQQVIKTIFLAGRSKEDIIQVMRMVAKQDYLDWTIRTVKMKMPEFVKKVRPTSEMSEFDRKALERFEHDNLG